jgi:hypothetical protein
MEEIVDAFLPQFEVAIICALCDETIKSVSYDEFCCKYSSNPFIVCPSCKAAWKAVKKEKSAREEKKG